MSDTLLLVEDNPIIMNINSGFLRDSGFNIIEARNVAEAEILCGRHHPDLVVMGIVFPDGNGIQLCENIRKESHVPILFLSAGLYTRSIVECLSKGGDDYLPMPYEPMVLLAKIRALLRRSNYKDYTYKYKFMEFNLEKQQVTIKESKLELPQKEFFLLLYMAKNADKAVSKAELYKAVWGEELEENCAPLWTAISRIKKKIEPITSQVVIRSRKNGYMLMVLEE